MNRISISLLTKWQAMLIIIVSLLVWRPVFDQVPMGEGYYYFDRCQNKFVVPEDCPTTIWQYDNLARISFQAMIPVFKDNVHYYMFAQVGMMLVLYITFYLVLSKVTKNLTLSFFTVLIFLTNHTGSFSMMAIGNYQRFVQRVPNLIPILISFYFLAKYFDTKKYSDLIKSIALYALGFYLAHHSIFMLPLFATFIFLKTITQKINLKSILVNLGSIAILAGLSVVLSSTDHFVPKQGIISFITTTPQIIEKTMLQIPNLLFPTEIVKLIAKNWPITPIPYPFSFVLELFAVPLFLVLIISLFSVKNDTNAKIILKGAILALPVVCLLNLYSYGDGTPHPLRDFGEDRIYFIPSIYSSILLGYFINSLYNHKKIIIKLITVAVLSIYIFYNSYLIQRDSKKLTQNSIKMEQFINYVKVIATDRNSKVMVIGPSHLLWPMQFVTLFYNTNNNLSFALDSTNWNETINKSDYNKIKMIDYSDDRIIEKQIR